MKTKNLNAARVWKQLEDLMIPGLRLTVHERALYSYILRHSRLERKLRLRFSIRRLARHARLSNWTVRRAVRNLIVKGVFLLVERSIVGHFVEVRLPSEVPSLRPGKAGAAAAAADLDRLENADFLAKAHLREAIHLREGGRCFYCRRLLSPRTRCLDHVVPQVHGGGNSYRNLVSCCGECNSLKAARPAPDFLRWLFRESRLSTDDLTTRLRALKALASGKLRPRIV